MKVFQEKKEALVRGLVWASPDHGIEFILQTYASLCSIGTVLSLCDSGVVMRLVAFFSRELLPQESQYTTIEKESLAIVAGHKYFQMYLLGRTLLVQTVHRAFSI